MHVYVWKGEGVNLSDGINFCALFFIPIINERAKIFVTSNVHGVMYWL